MSDLLVFALVGFVAQLIDTSLGMGFGVISSVVLLGYGFSPVLVSASINAAKIPTCGTAAASHLANGNVDRTLVVTLFVAGAIGGVLGMLLLTSLKGWLLNALISVYLIAIGALIIRKGVAAQAAFPVSPLRRRLIGFAGGIVEGIGGSWGPIVTTGLLSSGTPSRFAIGSSIAAEFVVSTVVFSAYMTAFATGYWDDAAWHAILLPVAGLVIGGLPAAILGGYLPRIAAARTLTIAVGVLAISAGAFRLLTQ